MNKKPDFIEWMSDCAILAFMVGLAVVMPRPNFPRNGLVAASELCMFILISIVSRRILIGIAGFFSKSPEKKAAEAQDKYIKLMETQKAAGTKETTSNAEVKPKPPIEVAEDVLGKKSETSLSTTPDDNKINLI